MNKTTTKTRAPHPGRSKKEACPICKVPYVPGVGLASHIRHRHANAPKAVPMAGNQAPAPETAITLLPIIDAKTHLQTAIEQLVIRKKWIDEELGRMDALRNEGSAIGKRIEALDTAMKAFGQESMAASG